jgi:purine-nucleoside phosphorylase
VGRAAKQILSLSPLRPTLGIILGSGFDSAIKGWDVAAGIRYESLPGFPPARVRGHAGRLLIGALDGTPVILLNGRSHYYEGHTMQAVTQGVRILFACGVRDLLLTNAAGGLNRTFRPGSLMLLTDHINLMGASPLRGPEMNGLTRFVDLNSAYDVALSGLLRKAARSCRLKLHPGVYLAVSGPNYETPAEVRAFARLGADAVGMSTVPEVIVARQLGMRVAAISCITNPAAGLGRRPLSHAEVLDQAARSGADVARLLLRFGRLYANARSGVPAELK